MTSEPLDNEAVIHLRVPRELKARWVALSQQDGKKLTQWIVEHVERATIVATGSPDGNRTKTL